MNSLGTSTDRCSSSISHEPVDPVFRVQFTHRALGEGFYIVSGLMDDIRNAVTDYQVSDNPKTFLQTPSFEQPV